MAAPVFQKIRMIPESEAKSLTIATPTGSVAGETLVIGLCIFEKKTVVTPPGWTKVLETLFGVETIVLLALPDWNGTTTSYTIEWGGTTGFPIGAIMSYSGADNTTPVPVVGATKTASTSAASIKGLTTTTNENLLTAWVFNQFGGGITTPPSGWTEDGSQGGGPAIIAKNAAVNAGSQAEVTLTMSGAGNWFSFMTAMQPPQVATVQPTLSMVI